MGNPEPIAHWVDIKRVNEPRGVLAEFCFDSFPFSPARSFVIGPCPVGTIRGGHAHRDTTQLLVCLQGLITIELRKGVTRTVQCRAGGPGLLIPPKVWAQQHYVDKDSILLVFASLPYDQNSYIYEVEAI